MDGVQTPITFDFGDGRGPVPAHQHPRGGGWVDDTAKVDATATVGPDATVGEDASKAPVVPVIPVIPHIDATILAAVDQDGCSLEMSAWHRCETTHCRAGWAVHLAVHLAGQAGYDLEAYWGSWLAGSLIYRASRPNTRTPDFYASNDAAIADLRAWAAKDPLPPAMPA